MAFKSVTRLSVGYSYEMRNVTLFKHLTYGLVRCLHHSPSLSTTTASNARKRPTLQRIFQPSVTLMPSALVGRRSIFIQTEETPNSNALKFLPNQPVLPPGLTTSFIEYLNPKSTLTPPFSSLLASKLMAIPDVTSVFYGSDFITVTKNPEAEWIHIKPEIFSLITEMITSGHPIVDLNKNRLQEMNNSSEENDSLSYNENDSEVVGMIKELLELRIRPAIQEDGGDIEFKGFENGEVLLRLRGACRTCDSSTVTLKNGIEGMLMHYIEEVKGVRQVLDEKEEISAYEFAKFEEKLHQQKSADRQISGEKPTIVSTNESSIPKSQGV